MIGVRFNKAMRPWGPGDIAALPADLAKRIVDDGDGELCELPASPHAHELGQGASPEKRKPKLGLPKQTYMTKEG